MHKFVVDVVSKNRIKRALKLPNQENSKAFLCIGVTRFELADYVLKIACLLYSHNSMTIL